MTTWNYRVTHYEVDGESVYGIREVYYGEHGTVQGWSQSSMAPHGDTLDELREDVDHMRDAFDKPVLRLSPDLNSLEQTDG